MDADKYDDIYDLVRSITDISREEFEDLVDRIYAANQEKINRRAAAILVAKKFGIDITEIMYPPIVGRLIEVGPVRIAKSLSGGTPFVLFAIVDEKKRIQDLYLVIKEVIKKAHGDFISRLIDVADKYWREGFNVIFVLEDLKGITKRIEKIHPSFNRWLHSQWCYRKFAVMLETKGYPVKYVEPKDTSKICHRCGKQGKTYGKHKRLFKCNYCGLKDFNRDLNAARNIALKLIKK